MAYVTWVLRHCNHNGFPVVRGAPGDSDDDNSEHISLNQEEGQSSREGPLDGVILRSQLMVLLINKVALLLQSLWRRAMIVLNSLMILPKTRPFLLPGISDQRELALCVLGCQT